MSASRSIRNSRQGRIHGNLLPIALIFLVLTLGLAWLFLIHPDDSKEIPLELYSSSTEEAADPQQNKTDVDLTPVVDESGLQKQALQPNAGDLEFNDRCDPPRLHGIVRDRAGNPVDAAEVRAVRIRDLNLDLWPSTYTRSTTRSSEEGYFTFGEVPAGTYALTAATTDSGAEGLELSGRAESLVAGPHQHPEGRDHEVEIVLHPAGRIQGVVLGAEGNPLSKARVFPAKDRGAWVDTDRSGRFSIKGLPLGKHDILVLAEGYTQGRAPGVLTGEEDLEIRFSEGVFIKGLVLHRDEPMADIQMTATCSTGGTILDQATRTAADGSYCLGPLLPSWYYYGVRTEQRFTAPAQRSESLKAGEILEAETIHLESLGSISGEMVDADTGEPLPGVWLRARPRGRRSFYIPFSCSHARTDNQGRFQIKGLPATVYVLLVTSAGRYIPAVVLEGTQIALQPGEHQEGHRVTLQKGITVDIRLSDPSSKPIIGAGFRMQTPSGGATYSDLYGTIDPFHKAKDLGNGTYRITGMRTGEIEFIAWARGFQDLTERVMVEEGQDPFGLDLSLMPAESVSGRIEDEQGNAVAGAWIKTSRVRFYSDTRSDRLMQEEETFSAQDGRFVLHEQQADEINILAEAEGCIGLKDWIDIQPEEELVLTLKRTGTSILAGRVLNDLGRPIPGAMVEASQRKNKKKQAKTDEAGRFKIDELLEGKVYVNVDSEQGVIEKGSLQAEAGCTDLKITLLRFGRIEGQAVDHRGEPIVSFRVNVRGREYISLGSDGAGHAGGFVIEKAPPGSMQLTAESEGYIHEDSIQVELEPGQTVRNVKLVLLPEATLSGEVRDAATGKPVKGSSLFLAYRYSDRISNEGEAPLGVSAADGGFLLRNISPGTHELMAVHPDYYQGISQPIELKAGGKVEGVSILLTPGGSLTGRVLKDGRSLAGVEVMLLEPGRRHYRIKDTH